MPDTPDIPGIPRALNTTDAFQVSNHVQDMLIAIRDERYPDFNTLEGYDARRARLLSLLDLAEWDDTAQSFAPQIRQELEALDRRMEGPLRAREAQAAARSAQETQTSRMSDTFQERRALQESQLRARIVSAARSGDTDFLRSHGIDLSKPRSSMYANFLRGQGIDVPVISEGPAQQELFSPGEIGGAQGPVNPQERGSTMVSRSDDLPPPPPVGERSPPGSLTAARNAAAARATEEANRARMLRNAGIRSGLETLGTAAEAGMLGYNTIQEGDPLRGAMRTGAETIEGVGSILRAPEAAVEMTGAPLPPWENPLRHLSETGDAITRVASPYRRWQEREARIRENTPDRVTQQREARSEAVRRALAPKE